VHEIRRDQIEIERISMGLRRFRKTSPGRRCASRKISGPEPYRQVETSSLLDPDPRRHLEYGAVKN
jgi:hypothetical protein